MVGIDTEDLEQVEDDEQQLSLRIQLLDLLCELTYPCISVSCCPLFLLVNGTLIL
jgi:hypothetical protein